MYKGFLYGASHCIVAAGTYQVGMSKDGVWGGGRGGGGARGGREGRGGRVGGEGAREGCRRAVKVARKTRVRVREGR